MPPVGRPDGSPEGSPDGIAIGGDEGTDIIEAVGKREGDELGALDDGASKVAGAVGAPVGSVVLVPNKSNATYSLKAAAPAP